MRNVTECKTEGQVFCRTGSTHKFGSPEAARQFGAGVNEMFRWPVDLTSFDLEVLLCIDTGNVLKVSLGY